MIRKKIYSMIWVSQKRFYEEGKILVYKAVYVIIIKRWAFIN